MGTNNNGKKWKKLSAWATIITILIFLIIAIFFFHDVVKHVVMTLYDFFVQKK